ncbi:helix-turn-helix transcriptional regulator [Streptomyces sp. SID10853]|uniref:helix-turn-helix domain-containing protein n=1 Tax=Streptomyces sp. SID10853 TaxID=2706028 RepID=UPI0013BFCF3A|nr:helix-turn-helix transcriptional regulator [Streptomyces sp. SID10853]NDZ80307.1 helix-turn-helix transcriptional regulator [Streptomyces sp. SID10853]
MLDQPETFGSALRRARTGAGLTLTQLSSLIHYSKGQLSKVETGRKHPTPELARLCDGQLRQGGALLALVPGRSAGRRPRSPDGTGPPAQQAAALPGRRQVVALGAAPLLGLLPGAGPPGPGADPADGTLLDVSRALFDQFRRLGQTAPASAVLPALAAQTQALQVLAARCGPRTARGLLALSASYAEFAGWMAQESGDDSGALSWTDHAVALASASGDRDLAAYALVRRGLIAYYSGDAAGTVAPAQQVRRSHPAPPRIMGLAAQREGQGYALAGEYGPAMRALDRARGLLAADSGDTGGPVLGTTHLTDPVAMTTAWSLLDLGRAGESAAALDREMAKVPAGALRTRARYGVRQALAHALAGEIDHACFLAGRLLGDAHTIGSATVGLDLRRLARVLGRHPARTSVRELSPQLASVLAPARPDQ